MHEQACHVSRNAGSAEEAYLPAVTIRVHAGLLGVCAHARCAHLMRREHGEGVLLDTCTGCIRSRQTHHRECSPFILMLSRKLSASCAIPTPVFAE